MQKTALLVLLSKFTSLPEGDELLQFPFKKEMPTTTVKKEMIFSIKREFIASLYPKE